LMHAKLAIEIDRPVAAAQSIIDTTIR
jgi:hypothetical protein